MTQNKKSLWLVILIFLVLTWAIVLFSKERINSVFTAFIPSIESTIAVLVGSNDQAVLSLSPNSGSYQVDDTFDVVIYFNTDNQSVVVAAAYIDYDPSIFEVISIDTSQSSFNLETENSASGGQIKITRGTPTPGVNSASGRLATVRFKALVVTSPSSDNITFSFFGAGASGDSEVILDDGNGTDILSGVNNARFTIVPIAIDTTAPVISNISTSMTDVSAVVSWTTNKSANSRVQYGLTASYGTVSAVDSSLVTSHQLTLVGLAPATTYHFQISSMNGSDNIGWSEDQTFVTNPAGSQYPEGSLLRAQGDFKVYIINAHNYKRHIFNEAIFNMYGHLKWTDIKEVSQATIDLHATSDIYRAAGDEKVYSLEEIDEANGIAIKHHLNMTSQAFEAKGYRWPQVFVVNPEEIDYYQTGSDLTD